jgi:hypothetical protein
MRYHRPKCSLVSRNVLAQVGQKDKDYSWFNLNRTKHRRGALKVIVKWVSGWMMDGWVDGRMDRWVDGWTDRWRMGEGRMYVFMYV